MKRVLVGVFSALLMTTTTWAQGESTAGDKKEESGAAKGVDSYEGKVVVIDAGEREMNDLRKFRHWKEILERAEKEKARAVVFRVSANGGYVDSTLELVEVILKVEVPTYAIVEEGAHSVGALLAVSTGTIYIKSGALIGGGGFVDDEVGEGARRQRQSLISAKLRAVAAKQGHRGEVLQALLIPAGEAKTFGTVQVAKESVLTLTGAEAVAPYEGRPLLAKGLAESLEQMLEQEGLSDVPQVAGEVAAEPESGKVPFAERQGLADEDEGPKKDIPGLLEEESFKGQIVVLKIGESDLINKQSFKFWRRMLRRAETEGAAAVIFELDTPGGYAFKTKEMMTEVTRLKIPTFAFVNEDALSAGALVSVATDGIYMNPDSLIGAAGLVSGSGQAIEETMRDKLHSVFSKHVQTVAEKKGYDPELILAMMIADEERDRVFGEVVVKKGDLLTLTAKEATSLRGGKPLLAKAIVTSIEEIAKLEGLEGATIVRPQPTPFEKFAWWTSQWSFLLILIGMAAAYAEMKAPGFGVGGIISLSAFALFFFGNYAAGNLANYELIALFVLGVVLVLVEVLLIPGTGIAGISGVLCILAALLLGPVDKIDWDDWKVGEFSGNLLDILRGPALTLGFGLLGGTMLILILMLSLLLLCT